MQSVDQVDATPTAVSRGGSCVRLHHHALESVFSFVTLRELAQLLSVCRDFNGAVRSMAPIGKELSFGMSADAFSAVLHSPLARHVTAIWSPSMNMPLSLEQLSQLAVHMPNLCRLRCYPLLPATPATEAEFRWPPRLTELSVAVVLADRSQLQHAESMAHIAARTNVLLASLPQLPHLERLSLVVQSFAFFVPADVSFAPLAALPQLTYFHCDWPLAQTARLPDTQARELQALTSLRHLRLSPTSGEDATTMRLLTPPHQWQLEELGSAWSAEVLRLLPTVPTLTRLDVMMRSDDATFLTGLPNLSDLSLYLAGSPPLDPSVVLVSLQHCAQLVKLRLHVVKALHLNVDSVVACVRHMPLLRSLHIGTARFSSLAILRELPPKLTHLGLSCLAGSNELPATELEHVKALPVLRTLMLYGFRFQGIPSGAVPARLKAEMPSLESCTMG